MGEYELWVGGQTQVHTHIHTDRHINTRIRPGLGAGQSENIDNFAAGCND